MLVAVGGVWGGGVGRGMLDVSGHHFKLWREWRKPDLMEFLYRYNYLFWACGIFLASLPEEIKLI